MSDTLILFSDQQSQSFAIGAGDFLIGRGTMCAVRLDDPMISQRHCRVFPKRGRMWVEDIGSTHGTAVNQVVLRQSRPVELVHGDHIWVWTTHFRYSAGGVALDPGEPEDWVNPLIAEVGKSVRARTAASLLDRFTSRFRSEGDAIAIADDPDGMNLNVTQQGDNFVVDLAPDAVISEADVEPFSRAIGDLIATGKSRLVIDLGRVRVIPKGFSLELFRAARKCETAGGLLKVCRPRDERLATLLKSVEKEIEIVRDRQTALSGAWPDANAEAARSLIAERASAQTAVISRELLKKRVRLVVAVGPSRGQVVEITTPQYLIGRDVRCQLGLNDDTVSRLHAMIELRGGRIWLRDLKSSHGTILNERTLKGDESELIDGDQVQIGFFQFVIQVVELENGKPRVIGELGESGPFRGSHPRTRSSNTTISITKPEGLTGGATKAKALPRVCLSKQLPVATVVRVLSEELTHESTIDRLRHELQTLLTHSPSHNLVLDMRLVTEISRGAIVMLLARNQELARAGGSMRLCHVPDKTLVTLSETQLPMLVEIDATIEKSLEALN